MQNNKTAAAADRMPAAAAEMFQSLCQLIGRFSRNDSLTPEEKREVENLKFHAVARISDAACQYLTYADAMSIYDLNSSVYAGRIFRKAAAFELAGCGDFFAYLHFSTRARSLRACIDAGNMSLTEFIDRDFFEVERSDRATLYGLTPLLSDFYGNANYRLALNSGGVLKPYHKSNTFFCPLQGAFCSDSQRTRIFTFDADLYSAASVYGGGIKIPAGRFSPAPAADFYEVSVSDTALSSRAGCYIDFYRAFILEGDFQAFNVAQIEENGRFAHISEGFIWADGLLHEFPEGIVCAPDDAVRSYHSRNRLASTPVRFSRNAPYLAGFEVEKEDFAVKCGISIDEFERQLPNFRKERDGSLDCRSGFEFITPPLELSPRNIRAYFEARPVAVAHINAAFSTRCGGHIHISRRGYSGPDLFRMIAGHLPLLHALFPARADGSNSNYSAAMSAADMLRNRQKYQAINILPDRIEIRIFGAVRGLENLIWRAGLVLKLFKHAATTPAEGYEKLPRLFSHLRKVYATPVEMEAVIKRVEKYARKFEAFRPDFGGDAAGNITDAARFKVYRPATARLSSVKNQLVNA